MSEVAVILLLLLTSSFNGLNNVYILQYSRGHCTGDWSKALSAIHRGARRAPAVINIHEEFGSIVGETGSQVHVERETQQESQALSEPGALGTEVGSVASNKEGEKSENMAGQSQQLHGGFRTRSRR